MAEKNYQSLQKKRYRLGLKVAGVGLLTNILLAVFKLLFGYFSHSLALISDGVNNLSDTGSSIVAILGLWIASKPADVKHPFGHARSEYLASSFVSLGVITVGLQFFILAIKRLIYPEIIEKTLPGIIFLVLSILAKLALYFYYKKEAKRQNSNLFQATAADSLNDVLTTITVLLALVLQYFELANIDTWVSLAISLFIIYSGVSALKETIDHILGKEIDSTLLDPLKKVCAEEKHFRFWHDWLLHEYGPGRLYVSVHAWVDAQSDMMEIREAVDRLEQFALETYGISFLIHIDPYMQESLEDSKDRLFIQNLLYEIHPGLSLHDYRCYGEGESKELVFDVTVPEDYSQDLESIKIALVSLLERESCHFKVTMRLERQYSEIIARAQVSPT